MQLKVTVTKELTRDLNFKEVVANPDLDAQLDELTLECSSHGQIVNVVKEQLA